MDCSMPGLPVYHQLPELTQNSCPSSRWCHPTISSSVVPFSCLQSFPFTSGGQSIGVSASASVLPINIQDWFPLGWISLQSKGLSRVLSNITVQKHQIQRRWKRVCLTLIELGVWMLLCFQTISSSVHGWTVYMKSNSIWCLAPLCWTWRKMGAFKMYLPLHLSSSVYCSNLCYSNHFSS